MLIRLSTHLFVFVAIFATTLSASATERRFAFTYETTTSPKGSVEIENWATWKHGSESFQKFDRFEFRHELEIGVTDRFQLGLYLFDWQYDAKDSEGHRARWQHSGVELIYNLTNPNTDFIGSAVYLEAVGGDESLDLEAKLLLQKNFGPLTVAYNAIVESEWAGENFGDEKNGEFAQSLGVAYDLNKNVSVGAELLHEIGIANWETTHGSNVFLGPNASVRFGRVYLTATALFQVSAVDGEPDTQIRLITGFQF